MDRIAIDQWRQGQISSRTDSTIEDSKDPIGRFLFEPASVSPTVYARICEKGGFYTPHGSQPWSGVNPPIPPPPPREHVKHATSSVGSDVPPLVSDDLSDADTDYFTDTGSDEAVDTGATEPDLQDPVLVGEAGDDEESDAVESTIAEADSTDGGLEPASPELGTAEVGSIKDELEFTDKSTSESTDESHPGILTSVARSLLEYIASEFLDLRNAAGVQIVRAGGGGASAYGKPGNLWNSNGAKPSSALTRKQKAGGGGRRGGGRGGGGGRKQPNGEMLGPFRERAIYLHACPFYVRSRIGPGFIGEIDDRCTQGIAKGKLKEHIRRKHLQLKRCSRCRSEEQPKPGGSCQHDLATNAANKKKLNLLDQLTSKTMTWLEVYNVFFGGGGEPIPNEKDAYIDLGRCYTDLQSAMIRFLEPQFPVFAAQFLESEEYHKVAAQHYIDLKNHVTSPDFAAVVSTGGLMGAVLPIVARPQEPDAPSGMLPSQDVSQERDSDMQDIPVSIAPEGREVAWGESVGPPEHGIAGFHTRSNGTYGDVPSSPVLGELGGHASVQGNLVTAAEWGTARLYTHRQDRSPETFTSGRYGTVSSDLEGRAAVWDDSVSATPGFHPQGQVFPTVTSTGMNYDTAQGEWEAKRQAEQDADDFIDWEQCETD